MAKILVADDEPDLRNAVDAMLSSKGHTVIHAEDGQQALESIKKHSPDVIVCDIEMPKLRGFDVLTKLREHPTMSKIPVIFLTGMTDISYMVEAMQLNVNDFLTKPFTDEELFGAVDLQLKKLDRNII
jgi:chemosensory pili system protein ChpA (sensor histidine kinase/response regulator)